MFLHLAYFLLFVLSQEEISGVPVPTPLEGYYQPTLKPAVIVQDNDGMYRSKDPGARYAWNYNLSLGAPVVAARAGIVFKVRNASNVGGIDDNRFMNEANLIIIDHLDGYCTKYVHLQKNPDPPLKGDYVLQGEIIGFCGETGFTPGPSLLYTVFEKATGKSVPSSFEDFKKNGGVPVKEDKVPKALAPTVPQDIIDLYKKQWRACMRAEQLVLEDLAWQIASSISKRKKREEYFYHQVLQKRRHMLKEKLLKRMDQMTALAEAKPVELLEALQYCKLLEKSLDPEIKSKINKLKEKMPAWDSEENKKLKRQAAALNKWVKGIRYECYGELKPALDCYIWIKKKSVPPLTQKASDGLHRIILKASADCRAKLSRLEYEISAGFLRHKKKIAMDAKEVWKYTQPFYNLWFKEFPEDKEKAQIAFDEAEKFYLKASGK